MEKSNFSQKQTKILLKFSFVCLIMYAYLEKNEKNSDYYDHESVSFKV